MEKRQLGKSGIRIPPLMFGGNVLGWTADQPTSFRLLDALLAAGLNAIDTADVYSAWVPSHQGGELETVIGDWLHRRGGRGDVVIATKVGMEMGSGGKGLSKAWIMQAAEDSLRRLRTDYIDLYQAHRDDESVPLEETLQAFADLIQQGKVTAIGASNYTAPRLREALRTSEQLGVPRYETLQPHYNLVERAQFEGELEEVCRAEGLGVINYFVARLRVPDRQIPLRGGSLEEPARRRREEVSRRSWAARPRRSLDELAAHYAATPAQVALAWLIARPSVTAPIASATSVEQLQDLVKAAQLTLDRQAIERLDQASA